MDQNIKIRVTPAAHGKTCVYCGHKAVKLSRTVRSHRSGEDEYINVDHSAYSPLCANCGAADCCACYTGYCAACDG